MVIGQLPAAAVKRCSGDHRPSIPSGNSGQFRKGHFTFTVISHRVSTL
ncbi:hypothetical protein [Chryseobacterium camelliae]|nr:hypothetical protein [Chryseobacterium camelliae]